jgi:hypothetical protein
MTLSVRKLHDVREALFPLVRPGIPRPTRQRLQTLPTIRIHFVLLGSLCRDPSAELITVVGLVGASDSRMTFSVRKLLEFKETFFPPVR